MMRCAFAVSSAPVGSSARSSVGRVEIARAMATRCRSPPESDPAAVSARCRRPSIVSARVTRRRRSASGIPWIFNPSEAFSAVDSRIRTCESWKTNPMR